MPHIAVPDAPGIVGPMMAFPEAGRALNALAEPVKGSALDIPAEPLTGSRSISLARSARLARYAVRQRVQNSRLGPHNGLILRGPSPLTPAEREVIAAVVSSGNATTFCERSHAAAARSLLGANNELVDTALGNAQDARLDPRLRALLRIAEKVRQGGRRVSAADVAEARAAGADDQAIHDTVLIAAAFCMFNRYVDGLETATPTEASVYAQIGERLARVGYVRAIEDQRAGIHRGGLDRLNRF